LASLIAIENPLVQYLPRFNPVFAALAFIKILLQFLIDLFPLDFGSGAKADARAEVG